jgi:glycosyltransferase involved in cell wall biosynthesis
MIAKNASTESRARGELRDGLGIEPEAYVIAYFGFLYPYKRVDVLLDAFRLATDTDGGLRLLVIGDDLDPAHTGSASHRKLLQDRAERLGVNERIVWTGWLESERAAEVLAVADVCVFPFAISLGNSSVGTVASQGIPVIAGWSAETESAFVHEENVYFYRPADDRKQLAKAIEALAKDRRLASRLREGGLALHSDYFSWERTLGPIEWLLVSKEPGGTGVGSVTSRSDGS